MAFEAASDIFSNISNRYKSNATEYVGNEKHISITLYAIYRGVTCLFGSIGNLLVILAVLTTSKLRTPANVFIVSLAVADMCITAFMEPISAYAMLFDIELYLRRPGLCTLIASICFISCTCSLWNIGAIAVNRYVYVCRNRDYNTIFTWPKTIAYALCIWSTCVVADLGNFLKWGGHSFDTKMSLCTYDRLASFSHVLTNNSIFIIFPMVLVMICYAKIFWTIKKSSLRVRKHNKTSASKKHDIGKKKDIKLLKMLFTIYLTFAVCWCLYTILLLIDFEDNSPVFVYRIAAAMSHTSSSLNSFIYGVMNKNFRDAYRSVLSCGKWKSQLYEM